MPVIETDWPASETSLSLGKPRPARTVIIGFSVAVAVMIAAILIVGRSGTAHGVLFFGLMALAFAALCISYTAIHLFIREHSNTEQELERAKKDAEEAHTLKSAWAADITRQCRTSLTAIMGYCDLSIDPDHPAQERFAAIRRNAQQILSIIDQPGELPVRAQTPFILDDEGECVGPRRILAGRVLLAEDDSDNQKVIAFYLTEIGAEVTIVPNGKVACEMALAAQAQNLAFDLILMDVRMPTIDGCAATMLLRQREYTAPIVALTADATRDDRDRCLSAGYNNFLAKPFDRAQCMTILKRYLRPASAAADAPPVDTLLTDGLPLNAPAAEMTLQPEFIELRNSFCSELHSRIEAIEAAMAAHDTGRVGDLAHQLKGTAGCYGLAAISESAAALQTAAQDPQHENMTQCIAQLADRCRQAGVAKAA